ncbi:MAG TPA: cation-translocating P-type ATPase [Actinomycetota bacterium]|nr:cation-translocating P-type ATPase [Actinomycetota bacterium]
MAATTTADVDPERGLTAAEVAERVARGQVNDVPAAPTRTVAQIVRANVFTRFNAILGAMLAIILVVGPLQDALFGIVLIANAGIGIVQELRAKRTLDRLTVLTAPKARVVRDGGVQELAVGDVVLDDVLDAPAGSEIVVDGEVLASRGLEVDESLLTGEADPVDKSPGDEVLSGSFVAAGAGRYRATKVGAEAYAVQLAEDARRFTLTRSELRSGIDTILTYVTFAIVPTAALLFLSQIRAVPGDWREAMSGAVAGTVAMVPEGLVLLTSLAFAVAVVRLAQRKVLVQELPAVEGLARVDVLCIDKTGTLTEGKLAVEDVEPLDGNGQLLETALGALAAADPSPNATTTAIAERFADSSGWQAADGVPFSSARKWSGSAFDGEGAWFLGAPDVMLVAIADAGSVGERVHELADQGQRVLLVAHARALTGDRLPSDLEVAGLAILGDRPRPDAADTLRYFRQQDVTVKVISGDDPRTVGAIASRLGLEGADEPIDARGLPEDSDELAGVLEAHSVFGRVTPQQKRAMVQALQSHGHTVAMTGDGVNDALALKDADIGVAMGSGSDATRAVAQLVLLDSTFDSLPPVVAEGRRVLGNIERTSGLYLNKTVYAMLISLATGVLGFVFPFLPRHLTLVGALTIGIPSFFLALAPNTDRFRPGFVKRVLRFAIPTGTLAAIATLLAYSLARDEPGVSLVEAQTTAVMVLTWIGFLVLSIIAAPLTRARLALIWAMAGLFVIAVTWAPSQEFFALDDPPLIVWLAGFGIAAIVWSFARLLVPGELPVGPRAGDPVFGRRRGSDDEE